MAGDPIARDVIIADNDYIIRGILRSVLEDRNFSVLPAVDGIEAIDLAVRTRACLVILDYMMPRLDGIATCAEIRCLPAYRNVPIIILTVFDDDSTRTAAQQAGATMFLTKPFRPIDLLQAVTRLLGLSKADSGLDNTTGDRAAFVWKRRVDPAQHYVELPELSEGRRILGIYRR